MRLPLAHPPPNGSRFCEVLWSEEKGSDVNLATMLLVDAYEGDCERAAIISNDSDLALAIKHAKTKLEHGVVVFNPHPGRNARKHRLRDANGEFVKPASW